MDFTPHTDEDVRLMLSELGRQSIDDLFAHIPEPVRMHRPLRLPAPRSEPELQNDLASLASRNRAIDGMVCFAGGGAYDHYIPACVQDLAGRSEFKTSYTPYQPEMSQGTLAALFEYQTMVAELTGCGVANASLYDGASALVEAASIAVAETGRSTLLISEGINPNYRQVLATFCGARGIRIEILETANGVTHIADPARIQQAAAVFVAQPNFFGILEDIPVHVSHAHGGGALLVCSMYPMCAGLVEGPGLQGADIVCGEGQPLGNALQYGGPYLGLFASRADLVRRLPGRLVGETRDSEGRRGFVLTLQAREQHIRRERASSNLCTNQTLMAITAAVYLSWLGPQGLRQVGEYCVGLAHEAARLVSAIKGCTLAYDSPFFNEFALRVPGPAAAIVDELAGRGYLVGPALGGLYEGMSDVLLVAVTEKQTLDDVSGLASALSQVLS